MKSFLIIGMGSLGHHLCKRGGLLAVVMVFVQIFVGLVAQLRMRSLTLKEQRLQILSLNLV